MEQAETLRDEQIENPGLALETYNRTLKEISQRVIEEKGLSLLQGM